ncbi:hypothetical protein OROMI_013929 [Orobanche minor]
MEILLTIFFIITTSILLIILLLGSLLFLKIFIGKSIRKPESPPVVGTVFGQFFYYNRLYDYQTGLARKHKTSRLLSPDISEIYTTEPKNIEYILKTNFSNYAKGEVNQDIWRDLFGQGILVVDGEKWRQQRKLASSEFSTRFLRDFSCSVFRKNAAQLVSTVREFSKTDQFFDAQKALLMRYTLDSISKVGFGVDLDCLQGSNAEGNEFIKAFDDSSELVYWRYVDPFWKLKRHLNIGGEAILKKKTKFIHNFVDKVIRTKREQMEKEQYYNNKEDILSRFIVESKKDPEMMTDEYLRDIILSFIIAGKDTTANTLSWFIYVVCKNHLVQERIAQEIREAVVTNPQDEASFDDFIEHITDEALEEMHYLHATLAETLRLYPAVPVDGRCAETDDTLPDGYKVKREMVCITWPMQWAVCRIYGAMTLKNLNQKDGSRMGCFNLNHHSSLLLFMAGPRTCLGRDFAYRQMKIVSAALLHFFRFRLSDEASNVTYRTMFTLHISGSLNVHAVSRVHADSRTRLLESLI